MAQRLDYKILFHPNEIKFQPAQIPLIRRRFAQARLRRRKVLVPKSIRTAFVLAWDRPLQRPTRVKIPIHACCILNFKISWLAKLRDLGLRPTQSPYLAQDSTLYVKPTIARARSRAKFRPSREPQGDGSRATHCTPHATPYLIQHTSHAVCHAERRAPKNASRAIKNTQITTAKPHKRRKFLFYRSIRPIWRPSACSSPQG